MIFAKNFKFKEQSEEIFKGIVNNLKLMFRLEILTEFEFDILQFNDELIFSLIKDCVLLKDNDVGFDIRFCRVFAKYAHENKIERVNKLKINEWLNFTPVDVSFFFDPIEMGC